WLYDSDRGTLLIRDFFRWNPPDSANVVKGILRDLSLVPAGKLDSHFLIEKKHLGGHSELFEEILREGFPNRFGTLPEPFATQEQEQYQYQEQYQEQDIPPVSPPGDGGKGSGTVPARTGGPTPEEFLTEWRKLGDAVPQPTGLTGERRKRLRTRL